MSDKSFTFFELHFHDGFQFGPRSLEGLNGNSMQVGPKSLRGPNGDDEAESEPALDAGDEGSTVEEPESESGGCLGCKLVGLGVLAAAAYAVRKLLSDPSGLDALDDIEELDEFGDDGEPDDAGEGDDSGVAIEVTSGDEPDSGGNIGLLLAVAVTLLLLVVVAAKKLLGADVEEIDVPDELTEE